MDLQALDMFRSVAKHGSISSAARELNYAQSNITMKIQQLETNLQTQLLYRHNRGTTLTPKGTVLLSYANRIFQLIEETNKVMKDDQLPNGPLVIGSMETTAAVRLPKLLSRYHQLYPKVDITLKTGPTEKNIQRVLQYEIDGAFVAGPVDHSELDQRTLIKEELVLITDTFQEALEIQSRNLLVFRKGCSYRAKLEQWLHQERVIPNKIMEFGTLEAIIGCVSAGMGISLLPKSVIKKELAEHQVKYHSIPDQFGKVDTVFIYRKDTLKTAAFTEFLNIIAKENSLIGMP